MSYYINRQEGRYHETCDEYQSRSEAYKMLYEYQLMDHGRAWYYVSEKARPNWDDWLSP